MTAERELEPHRTPAPRSPWQRLAAAIDALAAPLAVFFLFYGGTLYLAAPRLQSFYLAALVSALAATAAAVWLWDRGRWDLGLVAPPQVAVREGLGGIALAVLLIAAGDLLILASTGLRHSIGAGFPAAELFAVFIPAVIHEELLFRGYPFQRLWRWQPAAALLLMSAAFAALHAWNAAVTPLALLNIFLGGVLLSLAYAHTGRLWFPTGIHLGWNLMSGPILGYEVSGYAPESSVLRVSGTGAEILTGGRFGIEGSIWMTAVEAAAIAVLLKRRRIKNYE